MPNAFRRPVVQLLLIAAGFALIFWMFWPRGVPRPDESLRVRHPEGFSIVVPPKFTTRITAQNRGNLVGGIFAEADGYRGLAPVFAADMLRGRPDINDYVQNRRYQPGEFLGKTAYAFNGPRGKLWHFRILFESGGQWFEVGVGLPDYVDVPNDKWFDYFKTFRFEPRATTTTSPTTDLAADERR